MPLSSKGCYISPEGNLSPNTKDSDDAGKVGASAVGGFVGGVLITAVLGIVIHLLFVRRMRLAHMRSFSKLVYIPALILFHLLQN